MPEFLIRASSVGRIMTDPKTKAEGALSKGAKTCVRELVAQHLWGVDFEVSSKYLTKGIEVESDSISLLNRVRGLSLVKNAERRTDRHLTGECDLFDAERKRGHDIKSSWSLQTFPLLPADGEDKDYEWQARAYMALWDADEWEINYCLVDTPEHLIAYEQPWLHLVSHIPEHHRVTTILYERDLAKEHAMFERIAAAKLYYAEVVEQFQEAHKP